jgi:hypothetical protein
MVSLPQVRHVTVSIDRPPAEVYRFCADPRNLPRWAPGVARSVHQVDGVWIAESPMGPVKVRFVDENSFFVLDHDVTLPSGATVHNPMRVLPNGGGSEVVFSLFQQPGTSASAFEDDARAVARDLGTLKALLDQ